jgi:cysteinyl-tRNA synthetase
VFGVGEATFRHLRHQTVHTKGQTVSLNAISRQIDDAPEVQPDALSAEAGAAAEVDERTGISPDILALQASVEAAIQNSDTDRVVTGLIALNLIAGAGLEQGVYSRADGAVQAMQHVLPLLSQAFERVAAAAQSAVAGEAERASLLDLLIIARAKLRTAKQFSAADEIRDRLLALGVVLADSPAGTTWQRKTDATP